MDWNRLRYVRGQREGHYESYYLRANDPAGPRALWLRYTLFSPQGRPQDAIGEVWAIAFDGARGNLAAKLEAPLERCEFDAAQLRVRVGDCRLDDAALRGAIDSGGRRLAWDLRYEGGQGPLLFMHPDRYEAGFPAAKSVVTRPLARFSGTLAVDGETWRIDAWRGSQNHNWGRRHTDRYAFGQVCGFVEAPDSFLEVASARLRVGPVLTPTFTPLVLRHEGREHALTSMPQALRARGRYQGFDWRFAARDARLRIEGHIQAPAAAFVGLRYYNPPGGIKHCLNTKIARCDLTLTARGGARQTLTAPHGALLELLQDGPDPRVPVLTDVERAA
jgi:hypothetical protein